MVAVCAAIEEDSGAFLPASDAQELKQIAAEWATDADVAPAILEPSMLAAFLGSSEGTVIYMVEIGIVLLLFILHFTILAKLAAFLGNPEGRRPLLFLMSKFGVVLQLTLLRSMANQIPFK